MLTFSMNCLQELRTSSSAIAEGPRDALSQLKSGQMLHNYKNNHIWLQGHSPAN